MFDNINLDDYDGKVIIGSIVGGVSFTMLTMCCLIRRYCNKRKYRSNTRLKSYRGGKSIGNTKSFYHEENDRTIPIHMTICSQDHHKGYLQRSPFQEMEKYIYPPLPQMDIVYPQMGYVMKNHNGEHHLISPPSYRVLANNEIIKEANIKTNKKEKKEIEEKNNEIGTQTDEEK